MEITPIKITIKELIVGYADNKEAGGVVGFDGKLDIRPAYQREFIYSSDEQEAVIDSIYNDYPLNAMYWAVKTDDNGNEIGYEVLDGQQRTLSICRYFAHKVSHKNIPYPLAPSDMKKIFLDYGLSVFLCRGKDSEILNWFKTINRATKPLYPQEIRNALYPSLWLSDAKSFFSGKIPRSEGVEGGGYVDGLAVRQDHLKTVILWHSNAIMDVTGNEEHVICHYMGEFANKHKDAKELIRYFEDVIGWAAGLFGESDNVMKGVKWGYLYNKYKGIEGLDPVDVRERTLKLRRDTDVKNKRGIYNFIFDPKEAYLGLRSFDAEQRQIAYDDKDGKCAICGDDFDIGKMHADHITPWSAGGKTVPDNCQMLCIPCNLNKSNKI